MATKSGKKMQVGAIRSSRRLKNKAELPVQPAEAVESEASLQESDLNHQICLPNEQQLKLKPERESTSPPNHEALFPHTKNEKPRRVTRSFSLISPPFHSQHDIQNEQITPEENRITKIEDQDTSKKFSKSTSAQDCNDVHLSDINPTSKKHALRLNEAFSSPYTEFRKSYRKLHKREIVSIPYRKCHDALEGRIVAILNKLEGGKNCLRDFDGLMEKMGKITSKDLRNRFIVSGIKAIIAVSEEKNIYDPRIIERLRGEERKLQERLGGELDAIDEYQLMVSHQNEMENAQDYCEFKAMILRKLYHYIRRHCPERKRELKERLFLECQAFFEGEFNIKLMIKFIRNKLEGIH